MGTKRAIVLSGDNHYTEQITTTIKSIVYHLRRVKIYLINSDIPQEYFFNLNLRLKQLGSELVDLKINPELFSNAESPKAHISKITYGRLMIPRLVTEDRALYIDSDAIVDQSISELWTIDLADYPIAAVHDVFLVDIFNAGIILFNNKKLREDPDLVDNMLAAAQQKGISDADQTVLNQFFNHRYLELGLEYNYVIGYDRDVSLAPRNAPGYFEKMLNCPQPKIIHYASPDKPWNLQSAGRMREKWWQYHSLDWSVITQHGQLPQLTKPVKGKFFTLTASDSMIHLAELAQALPDYEFHVAAFSLVSPTLLNYMRFHNVHVYASISRPRIEELMHDCTAYLDINRETKYQDWIERFAKNGRPVYSFASDAASLSNQVHQEIFADDDYQKMVQRIQENG